MRVNTQDVQQGEQETRWVGEGRKKTVGNIDMRRSVEGRGMGQGIRGKQDGHRRDFQGLTRQGLRKKSREFEGIGLRVD